MTAILKRRLLFVDNMAAILERRLLFLDIMDRRSKIAAILSEKSENQNSCHIV
jgi:hypothetical protein